LVVGVKYRTIFKRGLYFATQLYSVAICHSSIRVPLLCFYKLFYNPLTQMGVFQGNCEHGRTTRFTEK
jgi:hypothetical protein